MQRWINEIVHLQAEIFFHSESSKHTKLQSETGFNDCTEAGSHSFLVYETRAWSYAAVYMEMLQPTMVLALM